LPRTSYGCPVAEVYYKYVVDGEIYTGIHEKGFILTESGEHYARLLASGRDLNVRLKPGDLSSSIVRDEDQIYSSRAI
jgi:hypothetical protein